MASTILYPPLMKVYQKTFIKGGEIEVYFAISPYNSEAQLSNKVIVSVVSANTNQSMISKSINPNGLLLKSYSKLSNPLDDYKYFITLSYNDFDKPLEINQYYKVQIRFVSASENNSLINSSQLTGDWMLQHSNNYSQVSTATLIRNISYPTLQLFNSIVENGYYQEKDLPILNGELKFLDDNETDLLNSYQINIYKIDSSFEYLQEGEKIIDFKDMTLDTIKDSEKLKLQVENGVQLVYQTDTLLTSFDSPNILNHKITKLLLPNNYYLVVVKYTTLTGYEKTDSFKVKLAQSLKSIYGSVIAENDNERGAVRLTINMSDSYMLNNKGPYTAMDGILTIKRASSEDNFSNWIQVGSLRLSWIESLKNYIWEDFTAESNIIYKYWLQFKDTKRNVLYSPLISDNIALMLDDMFLLGDGLLYKNQFNPTISNFKITTTDAVTATLGGKYPYIRRNGDNYYKTFNLGGLISIESEPSETIYKTNIKSKSVMPASIAEKVIKNISSFEEAKKFNIDFTNARFKVRVIRLSDELKEQKLIWKIHFKNKHILELEKKEKADSLMNYHYDESGVRLAYGQIAYGRDIIFTPLREHGKTSSENFIIDYIEYVNHRVDIPLKLNLWDGLSTSTKMLVTSEIYSPSIYLTHQNDFKTLAELYIEYNTTEDYIFEKFYRDRVMKFLTDGKPKLFKSPTEGNIIVSLTNVQFTPNAQLGRQIYSFTATATEIDEFNYDNLLKYNIIDKKKAENTYYVLNAENYNSEDSSVLVQPSRVIQDTDPYTLLLNELKEG